MLPKDMSLKGLQVFEALARSGSIAQAAAECGLSSPAVSQQVTRLEAAVGCALVDHARRPMQLTPEGRLFLQRARAALHELRRIRAELTVLRLSHLSELKIGVIEEFDSDVTPYLATALAGTLENCHLRLFTRPSHELRAMVKTGQIDVAIATSPGGGTDAVSEYPLLRDPFILVTPQDFVFDRADPLAALQNLPFLRYDSGQMIGRQIEAQLRRLRISLPNRFEIDSTQSIMALIANGSGWSIMTPLGYLRARRFADRTRAQPLPFAGFARRLSLFTSETWSETLAQDLATLLRGVLTPQIVAPAQALLPWLEGAFQVTPDESENAP